jgi:hypothetical protein
MQLIPTSASSFQQSVVGHVFRAAARFVTTLTRDRVDLPQSALIPLLRETDVVTLRARRPE